MFMPGRMRNLEGRRLNHGSSIPEKPKTEKKPETATEVKTNQNGSKEERKGDAI